MAEAILLGDPSIRVVLKRSARAKRLILRVPHDGHGPTLTLPQRMSARTASEFLEKSEPWLRTRMAAIAPRMVAGHGAVLPFSDQTLQIEHIPSGRMSFDAGVLRVPGQPGQVPIRVAAFLREEARKHVATGSHELAGVLGKKVGRITLRDPRSRWGSCTSTGDLMYSWRLIMAPAATMQYVVAHEVAHLVELNHSAQFWSVVEQLCPDYAIHRKWLQDHGTGLHRFSFAAT